MSCPCGECLFYKPYRNESSGRICPSLKGCCAVILIWPILPKYAPAIEKWRYSELRVWKDDTQHCECFVQTSHARKQQKKLFEEKEQL